MLLANHDDFQPTYQDLKREDFQMRQQKAGQLRQHLNEQRDVQQWNKQQEIEQKRLDEQQILEQDQRLKALSVKERDLIKQNRQNELSWNYTELIESKNQRNDQQRQENLQYGYEVIERARNSLDEERIRQQMKKQQYRQMATQQYEEAQRRKWQEKQQQQQERYEQSLMLDQEAKRRKVFSESYKDYYENIQLKQDQLRQIHERNFYDSRKDQIDQMIERGIYQKQQEQQMKEQITQQNRQNQIENLKYGLQSQVIEKENKKNLQQDERNQLKYEYQQMQEEYGQQQRQNQQKQQYDKRAYYDTLQRMSDEHQQVMRSPQTSIVRQINTEDFSSQGSPQQYNPLTNPHPHNIQNPYLIKQMGAQGQGIVVLGSSKSKFAQIANNNIFAPQ